MLSFPLGPTSIVLVTSEFPFRYYPPKYTRNIHSFVSVTWESYSHIVHDLCIGCMSGVFGKREMIIIRKTGPQFKIII
jgi:hypothetical protein